MYVTETFKEGLEIKGIQGSKLKGDSGVKIGLSGRELIKEVSKDIGCSQKMAKAVIESFQVSLINQVIKGNTVYCLLGSFFPRSKRSFERINGFTGQDMVVPARKVFAFKSSAKVKELLN